MRERATAVPEESLPDVKPDVTGPSMAIATPMDPPIDDSLATIGAAADEFASHSIFRDYQARRAANTVRRQLDDLHLFCRYLSEAKVTKSADLLFHEPAAWAGITAGLIKGFVQWQLQQGYSIASVNTRLATLKIYCKLAVDAGVLSHFSWRASP